MVSFVDSLLRKIVPSQLPKMMTRNIPIRGKVSKNLGDDDDDDDVMVIGIDFGTT